MKELLLRENINFKEVDVNKEPKVVEELVNLTGQLAIPVVRKGDNFVIGFDEAKIKELIS